MLKRIGAKTPSSSLDNNNPNVIFEIIVIWTVYNKVLHVALPSLSAPGLGKPSTFLLSLPFSSGHSSLSWSLLKKQHAHWTCHRVSYYFGDHFL